MTMNTKAKTFKPEYAVSHGPRIKAVGMRFSVTMPDWEKELKRAFNLAKSSGQELNITFSLGGS